MGFKRRLTERVSLVSQFDDVFVSAFSEDKREKYRETLEVDVLGDMKDMEEKPAIFIVEPLKPKYEAVAHGQFQDIWAVFAGHVKDILHSDIELEMDGEVVAAKHRAEIPMRIVHDIAGMIIALANKSGEDYFFTPSVAALHFDQRMTSKNAAKQMEPAAILAAAINKNTK